MFIPTTYTVEAVSSGHPDKMCDQISDAIVDACLAQDPQSRVAVECFGSHGLLVIGGEITSSASVSYADIAREVYADIGFSDEIEVLDRVVRQSPEIAGGVDDGGAGDQGIMYGFATGETDSCMPLGCVVAHALIERYEDVRTRALVAYVRPDAKSQVTIRDGRVAAVVLSVQHDADVALADVRADMVAHVVDVVLERLSLQRTDDFQCFINPAGSWTIGGFQADTGLTGRKLMVDTYGGLVPHGGGCFSGKDATKVDRSAAYMARYVAKHVVSRGVAQDCLVSVSYAIGRAEPVMLYAIDERGNDISECVAEFDFRPRSIISTLGLQKPVFRETAVHGHFGHAHFAWERV